MPTFFKFVLNVMQNIIIKSSQQLPNTIASKSITKYALNNYV